MGITNGISLPNGAKEKQVHYYWRDCDFKSQQKHSLLWLGIQKSKIMTGMTWLFSLVNESNTNHLRSSMTSCMQKSVDSTFSCHLSQHEQQLEKLWWLASHRKSRSEASLSLVGRGHIVREMDGNGHVTKLVENGVKMINYSILRIQILWWDRHERNLY